MREKNSKYKRYFVMHKKAVKIKSKFKGINYHFGNNRISKGIQTHKSKKFQAINYGIHFHA